MKNSDETMDNGKKNFPARRFWSLYETLELLTAYKRRIHDIAPRKKVLIFQEIVSDLNASGVMSYPVTTDEIQNKIKNLMRCYRELEACDDPVRIAKFPFFDDMKEIAQLTEGRYIPPRPDRKKQNGSSSSSLQKESLLMKTLLNPSDQRSSSSFKEYYSSIVPEITTENEHGEKRTDPVVYVIREASDPMNNAFAEKIPKNNEHFGIVGENEIKYENEEITSPKIDHIEETPKEIIDQKWERKRKMIEYIENRKEKRFERKLQFLREQEENKRIRHENFLESIKGILNAKRSTATKTCCCPCTCRKTNNDMDDDVIIKIL